MYAIVKAGGRQLRVAPKTTVKIDRLPQAVGESVEFTDVLAVHNGEELTVGTPNVDGAKVVGRVVSQGKDRKIRVRTYRAKKRTRRQRGHRQHHTMVQIVGIEADQIEDVEPEEEVAEEEVIDETSDDETPDDAAEE